MDRSVREESFTNTKENINKGMRTCTMYMQKYDFSLDIELVNMYFYSK